jgi:hypothetical protein
VGVGARRALSSAATALRSGSGGVSCCGVLFLGHGREEREKPAREEMGWRRMDGGDQ